MADLILWNNEGSSDKLWGVADYHGRCVTFWGRRGHELAFKLLDRDEQAKIEKTIAKKRKDRGYRESSFEEIEAVTPGFRDNFDGMIMLAIMGDNFRHTTPETIAGR